ncbi:WhiB family transcriptional regulator [Streptomyces sp. NPDC001492]
MSAYSGQIPDTRTLPGEWAKQAACIGLEDQMHPDNDEREIADAKAICGRCWVTRECFWDAVATGDMQHGIRAGLRPNERRAVLKELQRRQAEKAADTELAA